MIKLVEVVEETFAAKPENKYRIREIFVNPEHIVMVREDFTVERVISEGHAVIPGLISSAKFTKLTINRGTTGQDITVVGTVDMIYEKINSHSKQLLRG